MTLRRSVILPLLGFLALALMPAVAQAASFRWHTGDRLEPTSDGGLTAVSCPNLTFCVAADASGNVFSTTKPTATRKNWSGAAKVDTNGPITGVSCPTTTFCGAVDQAGGFLYSTKPTTGRKGWSSPVRIDTADAVGGGYAGLLSISCPSASLCVAIDAAQKANVLYSTDPTGGKGAWQTIALEGPAAGVSCPTTTLCVIAGSQRYVSTDPTNPTDWKPAGALGGGTYSAVDCVGTTLCVGVGFGNTSTGLASATKTPTGGWSTPVSFAADPPAIGSTLVDAVGCTRGTCVALDGSDHAYISSNPTGGVWGNPALIRSKAVTNSNAISCTSGMCVAVDSAGVETTGLLTK